MAHGNESYENHPETKMPVQSDAHRARKLSMRKLVAPENQKSIHEDIELKHELKLGTGWLAPKGKFYICKNEWGFGNAIVSYGHQEYAEAILFQLEGLTDETIDFINRDYTGIQMKLIELGYARIDSQDVMVGYDGLTGRQKLTLAKLKLKTPETDYDKEVLKAITEALK